MIHTGVTASRQHHNFTTTGTTGVDRILMRAKTVYMEIEKDDVVNDKRRLENSESMPRSKDETRRLQ